MRSFISQPKPPVEYPCIAKKTFIDHMEDCDYDLWVIFHENCKGMVVCNNSEIDTRHHHYVGKYSDCWDSIEKWEIQPKEFQITISQ